MKRITFQMIDELAERAGQAKRRRLNHNIHDSLSDPIQRLFIAAQPGSYFRPHRHEGKSEFAIVLRGRFDVILFEDDGTVTERIAVGPAQDIFALEIPADRYHTWIPVVRDSVFFEVKEGPYDPATSLSFAPWSPAEDSDPVKTFQTKLATAHTGDRVV